MKTILITIGLAAALAFAAAGTSYNLDWHASGGSAGVPSDGGGYRLVARAGSGATTSSGGAYALTGGFNFAAPADDACTTLSPPLDLSLGARSRYLTFTDGNAGVATAVRVTFVDLPAPFDVFNGTTAWVGEPRAVSELGGLDDATEPTFIAAALQCDPFVQDWSVYESVDIFHDAIVPGGLYEVQVIAAGCDMGVEANFSAPLDSLTGVWSDVAGEFDIGAEAWTAPDGSVDVATDVVAVLDKFSNAPGAPAKAYADLEPSMPDLKINITDVVVILDAFEGDSYPFAPVSAPCAGPEM